MKPVVETSGSGASSARRLRIIGAISVWMMIYFSPTMALWTLIGVAMPLSLVAGLFIGILQTMGLYQVPGSAPPVFTDPDTILTTLGEWLFKPHDLVWERIWTGAGYAYDVYPLCTQTSTDPDPIIIVTAVFGVAIGVVGALFKAAEINLTHGPISAGARWALVFTWGTLFAAMSVGCQMLAWFDGAGSCESSALFNAVSCLAWIPLLCIPIPIMLGIGWRITQGIRE